MKRRKSIVSGSVGIVLAMAIGTAWAVPQDQHPSSSNALSERDAYQAAHDETDAQARMKRLDEFVLKYPDSALVADIYQDYYLTYFWMMSYVQSVTYADKFLSFGDKLELDARMLALETRAVAYSASCDSTLQTAEAAVKAKDAATQGQQMLSQWKKPENLTDEQFAAGKVSFGMIFNSAAGIAESRLKGEHVACVPPPGHPDPGRFDRVINDILSEEGKSPRVR
jgi:hypothetical protein